MTQWNHVDKKIVIWPSMQKSTMNQKSTEDNDQQKRKIKSDETELDEHKKKRLKMVRDNERDTNFDTR